MYIDIFNNINSKVPESTFSVLDLEAVSFLGKDGVQEPPEEAVLDLEAVSYLGKDGVEDPAKEAVLNLQAGPKKIH